MSTAYNTGVTSAQAMAFPAPSITYAVASGTTSSITPGSFVTKALGATVVVAGADGDGVIGTSAPFCGIAASLSTETASAAGTVDVFRLLPGYIYQCAPTSTIASLTAYNALVGKRVFIDVTNGVTTIDTGATQAAANAIVIEPYLNNGAPFNGNVVYFSVRTSSLYYN